MIPIRLRTFLAPFVLVLLGSLVAFIGAAHAGTGPDIPDVPSGVARWWQDGRLAGPVVLVVFALLKLVIALSNRRTRGLRWLRAPDRLAVVSSAVAALAVVVPAAATLDLTWGGAISLLVPSLTLYASGTATEPAPAEVPT